jgi:hypothetical protein
LPFPAKAIRTLPVSQSGLQTISIYNAHAKRPEMGRFTLEKTRRTSM